MHISPSWYGEQILPNWLFRALKKIIRLRNSRFAEQVDLENILKSDIVKKLKPYAKRKLKEMIKEIKSQEPEPKLKLKFKKTEKAYKKRTKALETKYNKLKKLKKKINEKQILTEDDEW